LFTQYYRTPAARHNPSKTTFLPDEVQCYASRHCGTKKSDPGWVKLVNEKARKHKFLCSKHINEYASDRKEPIVISFI
jgi:hypothetical protein